MIRVSFKQMVKKVAIVSFFISSNLGDVLLSRQITNTLEDLEIIKIDFPTGKLVFDTLGTNDKSTKKTKTKLPRLIATIYGFCYMLKNKRAFINKLVKELSAVDAIILGGGNMIMDLSIIPEYSYLAFLYTEIAKKLNIPVFSFAVGVGPFRTGLQKKYAKKALQRCKINFVRDEQSYEMCKKMGLSVDVCGDPAFSYLPTLMVNKSLQKRIAICIADYMCVKNSISRQDYVNRWIEIIRALNKKFPNHIISLFSSEARDYAVINEVYQRLDKGDNVEVVNTTGIDDIVDLYSTTSVLLAMRMHSIIISILSEVPSIGLSWQPKIDSLFEMSGRTQYLFDITSFQDNTISEVVCKCAELQNPSPEDIEMQRSFVISQKESFFNSTQKIHDAIF